MILHIDTTQGHDIIIAVKDNGRIIVEKKIPAQYSQAEKLLPAIEKLLRNKKIKLSDIKKIKVANQGGDPASKYGTSFTALRIGVVTANALGYALGIPVEGSNKSEARSKKFNIVKPIYSKGPNITAKKD